MSEIPDSKITKGNILPDKKVKLAALSFKVTQLQDEGVKKGCKEKYDLFRVYSCSAI